MEGAYAGTEPSSIIEDDPQSAQLFRVRTPAFFRPCGGIDGRLNGLGAFFCHRFYQSELVRSICLRALESGDQFGMGDGWIHRRGIV